MKSILFLIFIFLFINVVFSQNKTLPICGFNTNETSNIDNILRGPTNTIFLRNTITIPVVVHVVKHVFDETVSDETILSQINILNRDFNAKNGDLQNVPAEFKDKIGNIGIYFCLITQDSLDHAHSGIIRVRTTVKTIGLKDSLFSDKLGGSTAWNTNKYLNIWVANTGDYITGIGSYPTLVPQQEDGVVIHPRYFGQNTTSKFGLGRVAVHEIGHYFGLYHTWGKTRDTVCVSDEVEDTPPQKSSYDGCPNYPQYSCGVSNMFMNFMDYVDDPCMIMFTNRQKARMLATLANFRNGLLHTKSCTPNLTKNLKITFYPNPTSGNIQINWDLGINTEGGTLQIFNTQGQEILNRSIVAQTNDLNLDFPPVSNGLYLVSIKIVGQSVFLQKIILSK